MKSVILTALVLSGCITPLHERFFKQVSEGEPAWQVEKDFGTPAAFQDSKTVPGGTVWVYQAHGDLCAVVIKDGSVVKTKCDSSRHVSPASQVVKALGQMSKAAGDAASQPPPPTEVSAPPPTSCTTEAVPLSMTGETITTCH